MEKIKNSVKRMLRKQWEQACNGYLCELLRVWELYAPHNGFWIGDEVGGVYDYADGTLDISIENIIYCVENDVTREQYDEWQQYVCDAAEFHLPTPNLKSWMHGCPRTPPETIKHLQTLKQQLREEVEKARGTVHNA